MAEADKDTQAEPGPGSAPEAATPARPARRRSMMARLHLTVGRAILTAVVALVVALAVGIGALAVSDRPVALPPWVISRIETRANAALAGQGRVAIARGDLVVERGFVPRLRFASVQLYSRLGQPVAVLPEIRVALAGAPLLSGRVALRSVSIAGASVALDRDPSGRLAIAPPPEAVGAASDPAPVQARSLAELRADFAALFDAPLMHDLDRIAVTGLKLRLADQRTGQVWWISDGRMVLSQDATARALTLGFDLGAGGEAPASASVNLTMARATGAVSLEARVSGVAARDLAAQSPALAFLGVIDAPISGALQSGLTPEGAISGLDASLEIGAGALEPRPGARLIPFEGGRVKMSYDQARQKLTFSELDIASRALKVTGAATAVLQGMETGFPTGMVAQVGISDLQADPEGLFADPVRFNHGALDLRVTLDPFRVEVGQLSLGDGAERIALSGHAALMPEGIDAGFDLSVNAIDSVRLLALWPLAVVPKTRQWMTENVAAGEIRNVRGSIRAAPGQEARLALGYDFAGADVRVIRTLPPVRNAAGYAMLTGRAYTLVVERGQLVAPQGGSVEMAGTVLRMPDVTVKGAPAKITLRTRGPITAALSLLDQPPFNIMAKAGRPVDIAEGIAETETRLSMPLGRKLGPGELIYSLTGRLLDVKSDRIVPGRVIAAPELSLVATPEGVGIEGPGTIDGLPVTARWFQRFGPDHAGKSTLDGTVPLSQQFLDTFAIALPKGSVAGAGSGVIRLDMVRGEATRFRLTSDLAGVGLAIPALDWSKPAGATGKFEVAGTLGTPPQVEALTLEAAGLRAEGSVKMRPDGALDVAAFSRLTLRDWFRGSAELRGRGKGRPVAIAVTGGTADLRRASFGPATGGADSLPFSARLDRLTISETLALEGFEGDFQTAGGLAGQFSGVLNGDVPVRGSVAPDGGRSAFRITSDDAGAVFRAAGIFSKARGGSLDLTLRPEGAPGNYRGLLTARVVRVMDAPVLASLLSAVSVIGLLEQMQGQGILFDTVEGRFRLTPKAVELTEGRAVGLSMGISMSGVYDLGSTQMQMQGVISPLYLLNGLGQVVARRGEGLLGFNYRLSGPATAVTVAVNPLSILTPGIFREIFRRAPPRLD